MRNAIVAAVVAVLPLPGATLAQAGFDGPPSIAAQPDPAAIPLPAPRGAALSSELWNMLAPGNPVVRNVTQPTLTPVLPAPGGGFQMLSMQGFLGTAAAK